VRKRRARRRAIGIRALILASTMIGARWSLDFVHEAAAVSASSTWSMT
jgi:hypothetical protein